MIPEIKKILYTTDLSESARYAFGYAASLANRYGAGVTFLHVLHVSFTSDSLVSQILGEEKWNELKGTNEKRVIDTIREQLERFCEEASRELPDCPFITDEIIVKVGNPVEEILLQTETGDCDLVVMGAHGQGVLAQVMMGSTSRRVMRRCKKPVLVVRLPNEEKT